MKNLSEIEDFNLLELSKIESENIYGGDKYTQLLFYYAGVVWGTIEKTANNPSGNFGTHQHL